jgi:ABC-type sugar transport system ATPase subunit
MAGLTLDKISKSFGRTRVINGVDLEIADGEFVVFVGPSGCGKSTILRLISGLESVTEGRILIDGHDVTHTAPSKRQIAMVFQSYALFPHLSVAKNIGFGLRLAKTPKKEIARRVVEVAKILRIEPLLERMPRQLSGGQRQRVAIGRSIIRNPKVFLFDEPLSNLDAALRVQMRLEIARLHKRLGTTMIYVTHDQTEAMTLAERIVVFNEGRIEQVGTPIDLYEKPGNTFVAAFIGAPSMNFLSMEKIVGSETGAKLGDKLLRSIGLSRDAATPKRLTIGIRPEHLAPASPADADFAADIELIEKLGAETLLYLQVDFTADAITMRTPPTGELKPGDQLAVRVETSKIHIFDANGDIVRH